MQALRKRPPVLNAEADLYEVSGAKWMECVLGCNGRSFWQAVVGEIMT